MKINKKTKITIIFIIIVIIICFVISKIINLIENSEKIANIYSENETNTINQNTVSLEEKEEDEQTNSNSQNVALEKVTNTQTYFILKQCMNTFYNSSKLKNNFGILDNEAVNSLGLSEKNVANLVGSIEIPSFTIDEIYSQKIDSNKRFYVVYHRVETSESTYKNAVIIIKIDRKNNIFSIYPYEFLEKNNLTKLKQNDYINLNKDIKNNAVNYYSNINVNDAEITKELYEKFKFNLQKDIERFYNSLEERYREERFENYDDFKNYIIEKKEKYTKDKIQRYTVNKYSNYTEYVGISDNKNYIFIVKNIMDYYCLLDTYTVGTPHYLKLYNSSLPHNQAKYCIDRVLTAINDKNYKFVYKKIDLFKRQSLGSYENFVKYLQSIFYDNTSYEFGDYEIIGENVCYDYIVYLDNKEEKQDFKRQIKIRIILQENADFIVMINE